ncbi:MAG TPA: radical SAM protein, partial [Chloroflexota bacterium]|nr:radical SAM protein [Chloroflexota bacterium]
MEERMFYDGGMTRGAQYTEVRCKTALNKVSGMPFKWSLNPYRGCRHACAYCLVPDTPVLYADLTWRPIGQVQVGDVLAGFDEHPTSSHDRSFRPSVVEAVWWSKRPTRRLITDRRAVVTTDEHRWLRHGGPWWVGTRWLGAGRGLRYLPLDGRQRAEGADYGAGYLTGITIGGGTFRYRPGQRSDEGGYPQAYWRLAMAEREPLDRLVVYVAALGITAVVRPFDAGPRAAQALRAVEVRALEALGTMHDVVNAGRHTKDYYRGFLAGIFDAEGSYEGSSLRLQLKDRRVLERVVRYGARLGFAFTVEQDPGRDGELSARLVGPFKERARFFADCRPSITREAGALWHGALDLEAARVEVVEPGPPQDVVDIQTSTRTFFAAGLASHNCYARESHTFLGLDAGEDFNSRIFVKTNIAEVLERELRRPSWKRESVALGTATDPYQGVEGRYRLSRACLEVLAGGGTPVNVTTKGTLIVRDADVLQQLAAGPGCGVSVSLITLEETVWRALEPGTPPPKQRLLALQRLAAAGVPCGIALAPVLPGLTDAPAALEEVVRAAADHGAQWLWSGAVHLEPEVRDWFVPLLARAFPQAVPAYTRVYGPVGSAGGARYAPREYEARLTRRIGELKARYGLLERRRPTPMVESSLPGTPGQSDGPDQRGGSGPPGTPGQPAARQLSLPL